MGKVVTSPVPEFPGTVTLCSTPTLDIVENYFDARFMPRSTQESQRERNRALLKSVIAWVENWSIQGQPSPVTMENIVAVPYPAMRALIQWLIDEIAVICAGEEKIPKVSSPGSISTPATPAQTEDPQS